jgi:hypothetical protein
MNNDLVARIIAHVAGIAYAAGQLQATPLASRLNFVARMATATAVDHARQGQLDRLEATASAAALGLSQPEDLACFAVLALTNDLDGDDHAHEVARVMDLVQDHGLFPDGEMPSAARLIGEHRLSHDGAVLRFLSNS